MASTASSSNGRSGDGLRDRRRVSMTIKTSSTQYSSPRNQTAFLPFEIELPEPRSGVDKTEKSQRVVPSGLPLLRDGIENNGLQTSGKHSSNPETSLGDLEVPQRYAEYTPFLSPTASSSSLPEPSLSNGPPIFRRGISPIPCSPSHASPLREYHLDAAHYHNASAAYHDTVAQYYDSAAEYHDKALAYHCTQARIQRVRFLSPVATIFASGADSLPSQSNSLARQGSMAGSIHGSDPEGSEAGLSNSASLRPASIMSPTDPSHSAIPANQGSAPLAAQGNDENGPTAIKWIIRAKTPSFSSDSEQEAYNGPSVAMNADKGWEPDVKKPKKKGSSDSSRPGSSYSNTSTTKQFSGSSSPKFSPLSGSFPQPGLQVPSFGFGNGHSRTSSGQSGEERTKIAEDRAKASKGLQDKDHLWAGAAQERELDDERSLSEIRAELSRSREIVIDLENQLMHCQAQADAAEKDFKELESEVEAFENRAVEFEKEAYEFKTKFLNLRNYTDGLQKHHNAREDEFMICNKDWQDREDSIAKQLQDLKSECDERVITVKEQMKKLEQKFEDLVEDRALISKTINAVFQQMRKSGKLPAQDDVDQLLAWVKYSHEIKKSKPPRDIVNMTREKAHRILEGQAFHPSPDSGVFDNGKASGSVNLTSPTHNQGSAKPIAMDDIKEEGSASKEKQTSLVDNDGAAFLDQSRFQPGVARLPTCSKGAWYAKMKTPKE